MKQDFYLKIDDKSTENANENLQKRKKTELKVNKPSRSINTALCRINLIESVISLKNLHRFCNEVIEIICKLDLLVKLLSASISVCKKTV